MNTFARNLVSLVVISACLVTPALAAKGGKPGGGGGGDPAPDACASTTSFFPSIANLEFTGKRSQAQTIVQLASADGTCERNLFTISSADIWIASRIRLHVDVEHSTGFVAFAERELQPTGETYRVRVVPFLFDSSNKNVVVGEDYPMLALVPYNSSSESGSVIDTVSLSPDGSSLFIAYWERTGSSTLSALAACDLQGDCRNVVSSDGSWFSSYGPSPHWQEAGPTSDSDLIYAKRHIQNPDGTGISDILTLTRDAGGDWNVGAPVASNAFSMSSLEANPLDPQQVVWTEDDANNHSTLRVCLVVASGCDLASAKTWQFDNGVSATWSRSGLNANPADARASILFREPRISKFDEEKFWECTDTGNNCLPLPITVFNRWDAY